MQTFLPYPDFKLSAKCLDNKRLGKQRVEVLQLLRALLPSENEAVSRWINHPACKMWVGYERCLISYGKAVCREWISRGYNDTCYEKITNFINLIGGDTLLKISYPTWFGDVRFHASHRSNLLRKDPIHYGKFKWKEPNDLPYHWPVK